MTVGSDASLRHSVVQSPAQIPSRVTGSLHWDTQVGAQVAVHPSMKCCLFSSYRVLHAVRLALLPLEQRVTMASRLASQSEVHRVVQAVLQAVPHADGIWASLC